nr:MAG TPA: hypothetical protein [Caudoviricetes sp.]
MARCFSVPRGKAVTHGIFQRNGHAGRKRRHDRLCQWPLYGWPKQLQLQQTHVHHGRRGRHIPSMVKGNKRRREHLFPHADGLDSRDDLLMARIAVRPRNGWLGRKRLYRQRHIYHCER